LEYFKALNVQVASCTQGETHAFGLTEKKRKETVSYAPASQPSSQPALDLGLVGEVMSFRPDPLSTEVVLYERPYQQSAIVCLALCICMQWCLFMKFTKAAFVGRRYLVGKVDFFFPFQPATACVCLSVFCRISS